MYEDFEILEGGWRLPDPKSMLPGTVLKEKKSNIRYRNIVGKANVKEANRASRMKRIWSEIEKGTAWAAYLPILGGGLLMWGESVYQDTLNMLEIWGRSRETLILLGVITLLLFALSSIASALANKYAKETKKHLRVSNFWERVEESEGLPENRYPELKGLAMTDEEQKLYAKEKALEELLDGPLNEKAERNKNLTPISDEEYSQ